MKRFVLLMLLSTIAPAAFASTGSKDVPKGEIARLISGYKENEGFECISIFRLRVVDYSECDESTARSFNTEIELLLRDVELLMEVKDGEDTVQIYGEISGNGNSVRDCLIFIPDERILVCAFRSIPVKMIMDIANRND